MKQVYLVLGNGRCGKSSLIRSLTGLSGKKDTIIRLRNGNDINISVWIRSAQEAQKSPDMVYKEILQSNNDFILLSIRTHAYGGQPNGEAYLNIISQNFSIVGLVILDKDNVNIGYPLPNAPTTTIPNSLSIPTNVNADRVRGDWQWV